jgi:hypothetical protein
MLRMHNDVFKLTCVNTLHVYKFEPNTLGVLVNTWTCRTWLAVVLLDTCIDPLRVMFMRLPSLVARYELRTVNISISRSRAEL